MYERQKNLKKVFFTIPSLQGGGAEKVMIYILKYLDKTKYTPVLILFENKGQFIDNLPEDIAVHSLNKDKILKGFRWLILLRLARLFRSGKPDVIVSFMWYTNIVTLISKILGLINCGVIISERYPIFVRRERWLVEFMRRLSIRILYPVANSIITNSVSVRDEIIQITRIPHAKITVVHNPVDTAIINSLSRDRNYHQWYEENIPVIISIGRLSKEKGFPYLLRALHIISSKGFQLRLVILGKGAEENELRRLAKDLGVENRVEFLGFKKNPYKYLVRSSVFILASLFEGFPNVLLEALALGVPAIATDCPTGPREIITNDVNGILVRPADERALADAIKKLLVDKDLRKKLSEAARKRAEDFGVEKIIKQYEDVIDSVCAASAGK
jgi:glycosyltransferase involved in cell wall biosynthesis